LLSDIGISINDNIFFQKAIQVKIIAIGKIKYNNILKNNNIDQTRGKELY
jgi:hypothetical protein